MFLRRAFGTQFPSTSRSVSERCFNVYRFYSSKAEQLESRKVCEVSTTGYSYKNENGARIAKYAIYWGPRDSRNCIRSLSTGSTHVAAILTSLLKVFNTVREENPPPAVVVYTDLKNEAFLKDLSYWAKRDFYTRDEMAKMKNSEILKDIFVAVQGLDVKLVHRPSTGTNTPNYVMKAILDNVYEPPDSEEEHVKETFAKSVYCHTDDKAEEKAREEIREDFIFDKHGRVTSKSISSSWPVVYVGVKTQNKKDFISAGYCTHWPNGEAGGGSSFRFAPFPVTSFRATLASIEEALKQAEELKIQKFVISTSSAHFLLAWRDRWANANGYSYKGKAFYNRINDLCKKMGEVHFRFEKHREELEIYAEIDKKCKDGLTFPLIGKDKTEYELDIEDLVISRESIGDDVPLVRLFKTGTDLNAGYTWNEDEHGISSAGTPETIISILEDALKKDYKSIIVRSNSVKLIKSFEAHMEVWRRNGWRNSLHKPIRRVELWEKAWELKQKVKVYWEYMDKLDEDDKQSNRKIPEYKRL